MGSILKSDPIHTDNVCHQDSSQGRREHLFDPYWSVLLQVTLPTGTRISVTKTQLGRVKFVNIDIKPSAADVNKVEGMFHS